jgi:hypothetical protein
MEACRKNQSSFVEQQEWLAPVEEGVQKAVAETFEAAGGAGGRRAISCTASGWDIRYTRS